MHITLCIGLLESRDGPFLGLRDLVEGHIRPRYAGTTAAYYSYHDAVGEELQRSHGAGGQGRRPLILLGHSYGASALFRAAQRAPGVVVDHLILLDPVPRWLWGQFQWGCYHVPGNVREATCIYNPWSLPKSSPIRSAPGRFRNIKVSPGHASIPGDGEVQRHILEVIQQTWQASRPAAPQVQAVQAVKVPPVVRMGL
jgi:pimeloyl-ACP methyl ester carboxylesterase